jgi:hypothetical protein
MPSYDIRLQKRHDGAKPVYRLTESNDFAAICAARKAAESGDTVEVWRGMDCIYAAQEHGDFSVPWPLAGALASLRSNA